MARPYTPLELLHHALPRDLYISSDIEVYCLPYLRHRTFHSMSNLLISAVFHINEQLLPDLQDCEDASA